MRLPLSVILVVAVIVILVTVAGIFVWRGLAPATSSEPTAGVAPATNGNSNGFALPASQGMATFTPVPQNQVVPTDIPAALPQPAATPIPPTPAPAVPTPEIAPALDAQAPVSADATNNNDLTNAPPLDAQAPAAGAGAGLTNGNIQVTPVPAVPVNGSGGGTSGGGTGGGSGNSGGSGSSGGGAACGTRLYHTVRPGENLFRIGLRYNTTAYAIARMNGITNVRLVSSGRRLLIVACARGSGSGGGQYTPRSSTYVVKPGDTLFRIALNFGINTNYLCRVNGLTSNIIVPGQVLVIP